ncbi:MAG: hypothetical protein V3T05_06545 [Myxococcota bacterium]
MFRAAGFHDAPKEQTLKEIMLDEYLFVWRVIPEGGEEPIAYAGIVAFSGPPFIFCEFIDGELLLDMVQDVILLLVHAFFKNSDEQEVWAYVPQPVPEEIHECLVEGGFDRFTDDLPGIDLEKDAAYVMERHTYDAYWGEGSEDPEI